nr:chemokine (C-C motif) receptor 8.2 [Sebastes schlegelii]
MKGRQYQESKDLHCSNMNISYDYSSNDSYDSNESYFEYDYNDTCYPGPELPDGSTVLPVLYYMLFCLSLLGNTLVLWVLLRDMKRKTMTDICLLNLALSDLILAASLPFYNYPNLSSCKLMTGVYQLGFYSGTLFVTLMSVDRYLAIVHAVAAMRARTLRYGIIASITIWVLSVIMSLPGVIFASLEIDEDENSPQCQPLYPDNNQQFWKMLRKLQREHSGPFRLPPHHDFLLCENPCCAVQVQELQKGQSCKADFHHSVFVCSVLGPLQCHRFSFRHCSSCTS